MQTAGHLAEYVLGLLVFSFPMETRAFIVSCRIGLDCLLCRDICLYRRLKFILVRSLKIEQLPLVSMAEYNPKVFVDCP